MASLIHSILKSKGPMTSGDLVKVLVAEHQLSQTAARQRVSRGGIGINKLDFMPLPKNGRFVYLEEQFGGSVYWDRLIGILQDAGTAYGWALAALRQRGGIMPLEHFKIACGAPARRLKGHLSSDSVLAKLQQSRLVESYDIPSIGPCVGLADSAEHYTWFAPEIRARLLTEGILIGALHTWIRNLSLGSYNKVATRDDRNTNLPVVGPFAWDLSAPSYVWPLVQYGKEGKPKQGFVVVDVLLEHIVDQEGIMPFLKKCERLRHLKNVGRSMQIMVAEEFTPEALRLARERGVIPATPGMIFGRDVADALKVMAEVTVQAAKAAIDPEKFDYLFSQLNKIEGALPNLRGALFEYVAAELVRGVYLHRTLLMNQLYKDDKTGQKAEVDIVVEGTDNTITFIECKGYAPYSIVPDEEIDRWLHTRIPAVRDCALARPDWRNKTLVFEMWTTGKPSVEASQKLRKMEEGTKKYSIKFLEASDLRKMFDKQDNRKLSQVFATHFLNSPLKDIDETATAKGAGPGKNQQRGQ